MGLSGCRVTFGCGLAFGVSSSQVPHSGPEAVSQMECRGVLGQRGRAFKSLRSACRGDSPPLPAATVPELTKVLGWAGLKDRAAETSCGADLVPRYFSQVFWSICVWPMSPPVPEQSNYVLRFLSGSWRRGGGLGQGTSFLPLRPTFELQPTVLPDFGLRGWFL